LRSEQAICLINSVGTDTTSWRIDHDENQDISFRVWGPCRSGELETRGNKMGLPNKGIKGSATMRADSERATPQRSLDS
jgi:hypothetical protein